MSQHFKVEDRVVRLGKQCIMVGEVVQLQDSISGMAHFFIDAIVNDEAVSNNNVETILFSKLQRSNPSEKST